ncbi:MAG: DMT family transporter [Eubacteriales bacterium]
MTSILIGQLAAISTAACWAITSTAFEKAGKKIGSLNLNLIRLLIALIFSSIFTMITRGMPLPVDATASMWIWLSLSGLIGMFIGDLLLLEAFVKIGARISMLIYASVPVYSAILAYLFLNEKMTILQIAGMILTIFGIALVLLDGDSENKKMKLAHPVAGILFAFGGAVAQSIGYVIGKKGMGDYNAFAATQIRLIAGIAGFVIFFILAKQWKSFFKSFKQKDAIKPALIGSFFGPFLGVSLSLFAVQRINPGVASTLMSITPVLLILYAIIFKGEKIKLKEIIGAVISFGGVAMIFM